MPVPHYMYYVMHHAVFVFYNFYIIEYILTRAKKDICSNPLAEVRKQPGIIAASFKK